MYKKLAFSKRKVSRLVIGLGVGLFLLAACGDNTAGPTVIPTVTLEAGAGLVTATPTVTAEPSATATAAATSAIATASPTVEATATTSPLATATFARAGAGQSSFTATATSGPLPSPTEQLAMPIKTPPGPITRQPPANDGVVTVIGTVKSFEAGSGLLQLGVTEGKVVPVKVGAGTKITGDGRSASTADIKGGMLVTAVGSYNGQGQLEAVSITLGLSAPPTVSNPIHLMTPEPSK